MEYGNSDKNFQDFIIVLFGNHPISEGKELRTKVHAALDNLAAISREIIVARYLDGKPVKLIAAEIPYSESFVRKQISLALHQLRKALDPIYKQQIQDVKNKLR